MAGARIFEPVRLGRVLAKNRVMQLSTTNNLDDGGRVGDRLIAFFAERAKGGVGSIIALALPVHPSSRGRVHVYNRETITGLRRLASAIHRYDVRVFGQLNHGGRRHHAASTPLLWAPSALTGSDARCEGQ